LTLSDIKTKASGKYIKKYRLLIETLNYNVRMCYILWLYDIPCHLFNC